MHPAGPHLRQRVRRQRPGQRVLLLEAPLLLQLLPLPLHGALGLPQPLQVVLVGAPLLLQPLALLAQLLLQPRCLALALPQPRRRLVQLLLLALPLALPALLLLPQAALLLLHARQLLPLLLEVALALLLQQHVPARGLQPQLLLALLDGRPLHLHAAVLPRDDCLRGAAGRG